MDIGLREWLIVIGIIVIAGILFDGWRRMSGGKGKLKFKLDRSFSNLPDDEEWLLLGPAGSPRLLFIRVPEIKAGKNRVHLDVQPTERTRDEEVEWLLGLGARSVADHRRSDGAGWVTLATGSYRAGMATVLIFLAIGLLLLRRVDETPSAGSGASP